MQHRASFSSSRFPLKYKTWLASQNPQIPSRIGSWNPTFSKNERRATYLLHLHAEAEKCFLLTSPSPKTLSSVNLRDLEAKFGGSFSE
jgi:hypothetical protein